MINKLFKTPAELKKCYEHYKDKSYPFFPEKLFKVILDVFDSTKFYTIVTDPFFGEIYSRHEWIQCAISNAEINNSNQISILKKSDSIINIISKMLELAHLLLWKKCIQNPNDEIEEIQRDFYLDDINRIKKVRSEIESSIKERKNKAKNIIKEIEDIRGKIELIRKVFKSSKIKRPYMPSNFRLKGYFSFMDSLLKEHITKINNEIKILEKFLKELDIRVIKWDPLTLIKIKKLLETMKGFRKSSKAKCLLNIFINTEIFPEEYYNSTDNRNKQLNKINDLIKRVEDNSYKLDFIQNGKNFYYSTFLHTPNLNIWIKNIFPQKT